MATNGLTVTTSAWINIVLDLTLSIGQLYTVQNTGGHDFKLCESATEPTSSDPYHVVRPYESRPVTPGVGLGLWVQAISESVNIAVTEG